MNNMKFILTVLLAVFAVLLLSGVAVADASAEKEKPQNVTVERNGDGTASLAWDVSDEVKKYKVKYKCKVDGDVTQKQKWHTSDSPLIIEGITDDMFCKVHVRAVYDDGRSKSARADLPIVAVEPVVQSEAEDTVEDVVKTRQDRSASAVAQVNVEVLVDDTNPAFTHSWVVPDRQSCSSGGVCPVVPRSTGYWTYEDYTSTKDFVNNLGGTITPIMIRDVNIAENTKPEFTHSYVIPELVGLCAYNKIDLANNCEILQERKTGYMANEEYKNSKEFIKKLGGITTPINTGNNAYHTSSDFTSHLGMDRMGNDIVPITGNNDRTGLYLTWQAPSTIRAPSTISSDLNGYTVTFACNSFGPDGGTDVERAEDSSLEVGTKFVTGANGENESVKSTDTFHLYLTSDLHDYCTASISASYENESGSKDVIVKLAKVTNTPAADVSSS